MKEIGSLLDSVRNIMRQDTGLNGDAQRIEQLAWMIFLKIFSDKEQERRKANPAYESVLEEQYRWENWTKSAGKGNPADIPRFIENELFPELRKLKNKSWNAIQYQKALIVSEVFEGNNYMKDGKNILKVIEKLNQVNFHKAKERHDFGALYELMLQELQSAGKSGEFYTPRAITRFIAKVLTPKQGESILDPSCGTGGYLIAALNEMKARDPKTFNEQIVAEHLEGWEYKPLPYLLAITNLILHDIEIPFVKFWDSLARPLDQIPPAERYHLILANPPFGGLVSEDHEKNFPEGFRTRESSILFLQLIIHLLEQGGRAGIVMPDNALVGEGVKLRVRKKLLSECNLHTIIRLPNSVFQPYASVSTNLMFFEKGNSTKEIWYYELGVPKGKKAYSKSNPILYSEFEPILAWWNNRVESPDSWRISIEEIEQNNWNLDIPNPSKGHPIEDEDISEIVKRLEIDLQQIVRGFSELRDEIK
jgi:type I restriction enzyme M protein